MFVNNEEFGIFCWLGMYELGAEGGCMMVCLRAVPGRGGVVTGGRLSWGAAKENQIHLHLRNILKQITYFSGRGSEGGKRERERGPEEREMDEGAEEEERESN